MKINKKIVLSSFFYLVFGFTHSAMAKSEVKCDEKAKKFVERVELKQKVIQPEKEIQVNDKALTELNERQPEVVMQPSKEAIVAKAKEVAENFEKQMQQQSQENRAKDEVLSEFSERQLEVVMEPSKEAIVAKAKEVAENFEKQVAEAERIQTSEKCNP